MSDPIQPIDIVLRALQERTKELTCLYAIEELLQRPAAAVEDVLQQVVTAIPFGWQYPDFCAARIEHNGNTYATPEFCKTPLILTAKIHMQDEELGTIDVCYTETMSLSDDGPFLPEELKLIQTIADRLGHYLQYQRLRRMHQDWQSAQDHVALQTKHEWKVIIELLRRTDQNLYRRVLRKMFVRLRASGVREAEDLQNPLRPPAATYFDSNRPLRKSAVDFTPQAGDRIFSLAAQHFTDAEILALIQKWIQEDRTAFLMTTLESVGTTLSDVGDALRRFRHIAADGVELSPSREKEVRIALLQRFFTDQLEYINVAKHFAHVDDFYDVLHRIVHPVGSHGKLGGKSAGLFLASRIIREISGDFPELANIKVPQTWYITSDGLLTFITHNDLEELVEHKFRDLEDILREYEYIVQVFKNASFTPEIVQGLSLALDTFEDRPLIVRSSSLLEDRFGASFSGKYKSLFLANQGTKRERLDALLDAVAEVYSSTFGPDPIQYRAERGLLDFREEMGIMIQEVVGTRVGDYFLPMVAGVAFSRNEFRWSPRIRREDGLIRMVMGLGTRAVDRLADDYPVLIAPGQPGLRVNVTAEETLKYSPNKIDVINLASNVFETVDAAEFIRKYVDDIPILHQLVSICRGTLIQQPTSLHLDAPPEDLVVTFENFIRNTPFLPQIRTMLTQLEEKLGTPVDIEFAHDGTDFYLLQCRPQSYARDAVADAIPHDVDPQRIVFTANRYISDGKIPELSHIVYVNPQRYSEIAELQTLKDVGRAVGRLNTLLPKRQFILMGPGRWGSRGDIRLGVGVTYSEIKNTAALVEIARKQGNYVPDLSFGTHFFQDLVEASIRYLPLYPDDEGIVFNEDFLMNSPSLLLEILPEFAHLADIVRVIHIPAVAAGSILRVLLNADLNTGLGYLAAPAGSADSRVPDLKPSP